MNRQAGADPWKFMSAAVFASLVAQQYSFNWTKHVHFSKVTMLR